MFLLQVTTFLFGIVSSLRSDTAINQNGGNSFEFQSMKQKVLDQN